MTRTLNILGLLCLLLLGVIGVAKAQTATYTPTATLSSIPGLSNALSSRAGAVYVVATRGQYPISGYSNGTDTGGNYRTPVVAPSACYDLQPTWGNTQGIGEGPGPNAYTVTAALEYPAGTIYPLTFGGVRAVIVNPSQVVTADALSIEIPAGATFYIRQYVSVASGNKWPLSLTYGVVGGDGNQSGTTQTDMTLSGTYASTFAFGFAPLAVLGKFQSPAVSVWIVGDSIAAGQGDNPNNTGFLVDAIGGSFPYTNQAMPGETLNGFSGSGRLTRISLASHGTHAIVEYGTNDLTGNPTLLTMQTNLINVWRALSVRGLKVFQTTITPRTNSTDSWATAANQTPVSTDFVAPGVRTQLNDWIRGNAPVVSATNLTPVAVGSGVTCPYFSGYFDVADKVESSRNSGFWQNNLTDAIGVEVRTGQSAGVGTSTTLYGGTNVYNYNSYNPGYGVRITGGTGVGQIRTIDHTDYSNIIVTAAWTTIPDATSTYNVFGKFFTGDGIHPNSVGHIFAASAISPSALHL